MFFNVLNFIMFVAFVIVILYMGYLFLIAPRIELHEKGSKTLLIAFLIIILFVVSNNMTSNSLKPQFLSKDKFLNNITKVIIIERDYGIFGLEDIEYYGYKDCDITCDIVDDFYIIKTDKEMYSIKNEDVYSIKIITDKDEIKEKYLEDAFEYYYDNINKDIDDYYIN